MISNKNIHIFASMNFMKRKNPHPTRAENIQGKFLILAGILSAVFFLHWLLDPEHVGYKPLYYLLIFSFVYKVLRLFVEWILYFHLTVPKKPRTTRSWNVDILTTYCPPEPKEMVVKTLEAIQKIRYPHKTYLCDEANDEELKRICEELDIIHVTREQKTDAKAGNINNALYTVADGEICVILDPDHIPDPDFLDEVLPYFEDEKVGFVQVPQVYYNQSKTIIAKAAAQQTYQFYGPCMMGLNTYGAVPAIGANCTFRRKALDSIGGHAPGLTEDMHTAMLLHAKKWKSVYNPTVVAKGLVPWNYSGYCLQQLKWARGSFDLLLKVLPRIVGKLKFSQIFYYLSAPIFYIYGLFAFFDFFIPIIVLITGIIPIKISIFDFFLHATPLFMATIALRQFNQRWLYEEHEKGAFILGGTLLKASWWTSVVGFIYTLFNKKVPYIPTPKDFRPENPNKLLLPNHLIIFISLLAVVYGISRDLNPFLLFMAFLALVNTLILSLGVTMAMQKSIISFHKIFRNTFISKGSNTRKWIYHRKQKLYSNLQKTGIVLIALTFLSILFIYHVENKRLNQLASNLYAQTAKDEIFIPNIQGSYFKNMESDAHFVYDTFQLDENFLQNAKKFSDTIHKLGKIPYFILNLNQEQLADTLNTYDPVFNDLFLYLRERYSPVFFAFINHNNDDKTKTHIAKWFYNANMLANQVSFPNIAWVWHTDIPYDDPFVDLIKFPVSWVQSSKSNIFENIDISAEDPPLLVFDGNRLITLNPSTKKTKSFDLEIFNNKRSMPSQATTSNHFSSLYIQGVAYNPGHDWRDSKNSIPLTLSKVEEDLSKIKQMGANTIRRYSPSMYDRNILKTANIHDLNVLYGFWFDPKVDYKSQSRRIKRYEKEVLRTVKKYRNDSAIIGWTLGNETWGLLKHHFNEPYLSIVRYEYTMMISELAKKIKEIDPERPVFTVEEHTYHLSAAAYAFNKFAPEIDIFGVNSYYFQNLSRLDSIINSVMPNKQYMIGEFGNKGYWQTDYNDYIYDTILYEHNSFDKADMFTYQWENYIVKKQGQNIGGIAFCWQDRYEATATWFGITDIFGNKKPSWYALRDIFNPDADTLSAEFPIPRFHMMMPRDNLRPWGEARVVAATNEAHLRNSFYYKWVIYEEGSFRNILETSWEKGNFDFRFKVPEKPSNYRLYLYVSDNNGNVVTESNALMIKWN